MERELNVIDTPLKSPASVHKTPDLSAEIARTVQKQPGDRVKCRRVAANTYRCNWFAPEHAAEDQGLCFLDTYRIRDSRFLRVHKTNGQLVIEDLTLATARNN
jgi:hypothetical protein